MGFDEAVESWHMRRYKFFLTVFPDGGEGHDKWGVDTWQWYLLIGTYKPWFPFPSDYDGG